MRWPALWPHSQGSAADWYSSRGLSTTKGIEEYLILLSVCQTGKYMGVDFLDFLRSGEKDIQGFAENRRGRKRRTQPLSG
jgi:hypothetical protein